MFADALRILVMIDLALIVVTAGVIGKAYEMYLPRPVKYADMVQNAALVVVGFGAAFNAIADIQLTPGLVTLSLCLTPLALVSVGLAVWSLRPGAPARLGKTGFWKHRERTHA